MRSLKLALLLALVCLPALVLAAEEAEEPETKLNSGTLAGLALRNIGPAINSGRIIDFAVTPGMRHRFFVATASGGVWRTENAGNTWTPVFDGEGSYSIGDVTLDPSNPNTVWVGTGENNSQRSVSWGDGVYRSLDGGNTWENMGLGESEHIGNVEIHPEDSNTVYVSAMGPLWRSGGDRGLYKTTDGGATWERILYISEDTGVAEVWLDPWDPETVYATSWQRARRVWTLVNGGPESAFHKSTDGGATWREIDNGLPSVDRGRMGLCISPIDPDVIYGILDAVRDEGGIFRSVDRGESWHKQSDQHSSGDYWNELFCDPHDLDTVYSVSVFLHVTRDGGKTFSRLPFKNQHVDHHAVWLDPADPGYMLVGNDGGVYESFDRGDNWVFKENLPITQFYRVSVDTSEPFYYVYGGTQDNNTLGGPSRTLRSSGISNEDWFVTVGGDGYETRVDPTDPNIVYSQWQYGGLVRYDRASEEIVDIQPQEEPGEDAHRWNWDSPLIISPHSPTRLYYAAQRVFRSDDRGNNWTAISGDLSRQLDRDQLEIMGRLWEMDAVHKNKSTSDYGNIVAMTESPLVDGLIYVGTDDGLIQVTEDGGQNWRKVESFPGVPARTYVSDLEASLFDEGTVYATFENHKSGDFAPYIMVSRDKGATWSSMVGDLEEPEVVYTIIQDHVVPELMWAGTEFGLYVTLDEGAHWHKMSGGMPTIQVRDLDIQRDWNDLAIATFGRGFYILDDYTPLREMSEETLADNAAILFPTREALRYMEQSNRRMDRGAGFWTVDNPPFGAVFTFWLRDGLETKQEARIESEDEAREAEAAPPMANMAELREEDLEIAPVVFLTVRDGSGAIVRRVPTSRKSGLHRVAWDLRWAAEAPTDLTPPANLPPWAEPERGPLAAAGSYSATLESRVAGASDTLAGPVEFDVRSLDLATFTPADPSAVAAFQMEVRELRRRVLGAVESTGELANRIKHLRQSLVDTPNADPELMARLEGLQERLNDVLLAFVGDGTKQSRNVFTPPTITSRVERIAYDLWYHTQAPTGTHEKALGWASDAYTVELEKLSNLATDLESLETEAGAAGAPWTPGRGAE